MIVNLCICKFTNTGSGGKETGRLGWTREHRWSRWHKARRLGQTRAHSRSRCQETRRLGRWNGRRMGAANDWQSGIQGFML